MKQGLFISFEGGEGAGKSTQIERLAAWLAAKGQQVVLTRQPGGTPYGQRIRELILTPQTGEQLSSRAELFLYLADRAQHVDTVIRPALESGQIVICDRYTDSTLAYQGYGRELELAQLRQLNDNATAGLLPDLTFWLDLKPAEGQARIQKRAALDRLELEQSSFHERVYAGYQAMAEQEPQRWVRVPAAGSADMVQAAILEVLQRRFF